jgi:ABC-2 type transport system ATP-binding protein/lipopolysaccharide transport system ATP-binding protein
MPANAIEVERLSKRYLLGEDQPGRSLRESILASVRRVRTGGRRRQEIWSLRDIDLVVPEGEAIGVIGRNGAGKSTLLKILSRITEPTYGVSRTHGRVTSLLEVGTGFHPELTGRENVYLNGAILGMSRRDMDLRFDEIVNFAGVPRFIDTPVKRYSSGMYLRLAFAVAAHLEPDIMVVDEVLTVGDAEFQARCLRRMETAEREGRTVVFVSHNLDAVTRLCSRAILLEAGGMAADGPADDVVVDYLDSLVDRATHEPAAGQDVGPVRLEHVTILDRSDRPTQVMRRDDSFTIEVRFTLREAVRGLDLSAYILDARGGELLSEAWSDTSDDRNCSAEEHVARLRVPPILNVGEYMVGLWLGTPYETLLQEMPVGHFRLEGDVKGRPMRAVALGLPWEVRPVRSGRPPSDESEDD